MEELGTGGVGREREWCGPHQTFHTALSLHPTWLRMRKRTNLKDSWANTVIDLCDIIPGEPIQPYYCFNPTSDELGQVMQALEWQKGIFHLAAVEQRMTLVLLIRSDEPELLPCDERDESLKMTCFAPRGHEGKHIGCGDEAIGRLGKLWVARMALVPRDLQSVGRIIEMWRADEEASCSG